jgi:hypothetical protein
MVASPLAGRVSNNLEELWRRPLESGLTGLTSPDDDMRRGNVGLIGEVGLVAVRGSLTVVDEMGEVGVSGVVNGARSTIA